MPARAERSSTLREADLERLHYCFLRGPKRNRDAQLGLGRSAGLIGPDELDDLLVLGGAGLRNEPAGPG